MTRSLNLLWLASLLALGCGGSESDAQPAPVGGGEPDVEIALPDAPTAGSGGDQLPDSDEPANGAAGASGLGPFPSDLDDMAGTLPPGVEPPEEFLPGFEGMRNQPPQVGPNLPPEAAFTVTPECISGIGSAHAFESTSSDPDGDPLSCQFTFPGGTPPGSGACAIDDVTFPTPGPVVVELVVEDGRGGRASSTQTLEPCSDT